MIERCYNAVPTAITFLTVFVLSSWRAEGFHHSSHTCRVPLLSEQRKTLLSHPFLARRSLRLSSSPNFNDKNDDDDEDDDDEDMVDVDSLGDWRAFRRNLVVAAATSSPSISSSSTTTSSFAQFEEFQEPEVLSSVFVPTSVSKDNEDLLWGQNEDLAREYTTGVWAHSVATPEVGGLVVRMPLEVEIFRNHRHSLMGRKLQRLLKQQQKQSLQQIAYQSRVNQTKFDSSWYYKAQQLVEEEMKRISASAKNGQIDASVLTAESADMLQLYLDQQETWQEVCLVLQRDESAGTASTLVLNRPMALKLTENLGRLVLFGAFSTSPEVSDTAKTHQLIKFMLAFGQECAVYIGGPDGQDKPALMVHGHADLPGAVEVAPGTNVYHGGSLDVAMDGVLWGKYRPMDFRFFVGRHEYKEHSLDLAVLLGKYQPVACARSLVLKQCISLPKPLWHEVLEFCGGDMQHISAMELLKREDLQIEIIDDDDDYEIPDELGELEKFDDEDEDFDEYLT